MTAMDAFSPPSADDASSGNKWQSVESLLRENGDNLTNNSRFKSMENVSKSSGLARTVVDHVDLDDVDVSDRMRRFKMENGKSLPNVTLSSSISKGEFQ